MNSRVGEEHIFVIFRVSRQMQICIFFLLLFITFKYIFFFRETLNTFTIRRVISGEKKFNREKKRTKRKKKIVHLVCARKFYLCRDAIRMAIGLN